MKKLAAIYNVWYDSIELLQGSIECIKNDVDLIVIVYQNISNFGVKKDETQEICKALPFKFPNVKFKIEKFSPSNNNGFKDETEKRNLGLSIAGLQGATHFFHIDCDEYYTDFAKLKQQYILSAAKGSVLEMFTYFKKPTLRLENKDNYYVPFIHKLDYYTKAGGTSYPFYCDPTRRINTGDVILLPGFMHHFSWIRKDISLKVNNSSARANIQRSQLLQDYNNPECGPGYYLKDYQQKLIEVENVFNIKV